MKRIQQGVALALLVLVLVTFSSPTMAKEYIFEMSGGAVIFQTTSTFFNAYWAIDNGFGNIQSNGPGISDDFSFTSLGKMEGIYSINANNLTREVIFTGLGNMQAITSTPNTITLISFTGYGWIKQQISTAGLKGLIGIYIFLDADYIFLRVKDDKPEHRSEPRPHLRLVSVSTDGNEVAICVENIGDAPLFGTATVIAGLSYRANWWVPESVTDFTRKTLGNGSIAQGETFTFFFTLDDITEEAYLSFVTQRGFWTSYDYPNPPEDCIGITLTVGSEKVFAFLPLNYNAFLGIEALSIDEQGQVSLTVVNSGIFDISGDVIVTASIASDENYSESNNWVEFHRSLLANGILAPGEIFTFNFGLPDIPAWAFEELEEQGGEFDQNYVKVRLFVGDREVFFTLPVMAQL